MKNLYGLVMAGGSGTRLWPISRDYYPKQFLKLFGEQTLIQQTFSRLKKVINPKNIYITTNRIFVDEIISQLQALGLNNENIIIQPADKNTAAAIAQASKVIFDKDHSSIIINCPSDHLIQPEKKFILSIKTAYNLAQKNLLVTFGVKPDQPTSELGYIIPQNNLLPNHTSNNYYRVEKFIEKPSLKKARALIKEGAFWNSGIFVWKAEIILSEIKRLNYEVYQSSSNIKDYILTPSISIDKAVLEKSNLVWVIPVDFNWKDIGSWKTLYEFSPKNDEGNVLNERVIALNSKNSLIYGTDNRMIAAINLNNLIVVDTKDYILIVQKDSAHEIKDLVKQIDERDQQKKLQKPLVSIITPIFDYDKYLEKTISSVMTQSYKNIEYILVEGSSKNKAIDLVKKYTPKIGYLSVSDMKKFEIINKGIEFCNGDIIGILYPSDSYQNEYVISNVVQNMELKKADVCWGDLIYVNDVNAEKEAMYWQSSNYRKGLLQSGWTLPHSTFFVRRNIYQKYGKFNTRFKIAAEYELIIRLLEKHKVKSVYIPDILVKMIGKGINLKNIADRIKGNLESLEAWKINNLTVNPLIIISKNISKIPQFIRKST